jgi:hypothetical protein
LFLSVNTGSCWIKIVDRPIFIHKINILQQKFSTKVDDDTVFERDSHSAFSAPNAFFNLIKIALEGARAVCPVALRLTRQG